ncbi:MAG: hypothetical protein U9M90_01410 [Patescibacteria group bacterium]|nr:hypothetical protein [Patescibacteria group bacterium]
MQEFEQFPRDSKHKKPENHLEEHKFEIIDEISERRLDVPGIVNAQNGKMTFGTDEGFGYKEKNTSDLLMAVSSKRLLKKLTMELQ